MTALVGGLQDAPRLLVAQRHPISGLAELTTTKSVSRNKNVILSCGAKHVSIT